MLIRVVGGALILFGFASLMFFTTQMIGYGVVSFGIDELFTGQYISLIQNKNVAVIAHNASRNKENAHLVNLLYEHPDVNLVSIFAPEHGFRSDKDTWIDDSVDPQTGVPIYSLYQDSTKSPSLKGLEGVDVLLIDLQDVGIRYYTYTTTVALALQVAKERNIPVVILDRVNPNGGEYIAGRVLDEGLAGKLFSAHYPMPLYHGMTMGELANYFNWEFGIEHPNITIVKMKNWKRKMTWRDAGYSWIAPSPALVTFEQANLFLTFSLLAGINVAVGRGDDNFLAFRVYGAPFVTEQEMKEILLSLQALNLEGVEFTQYSWIATRREFKGQMCRGIKIKMHQFEQLERYVLGLHLLKVFVDVLGDKLDLKRLKFRLGHQDVVEALRSGESVEKLLALSQSGLLEFKDRRKGYLLY